jgi:predicted secreted protein
MRDRRDQDAIICRDGTGRLRPWRLQDQGAEVQLAPAATVILSDGRCAKSSSTGGLVGEQGERLWEIAADQAAL